LLGVLPIPGLVAASMLAGLALFFAYVIASLREAFGFDLKRAAINGGVGLLAAYAVMTAAVASGGSNADALGFPRPFASAGATPVATPLATPLATPRPALHFATPRPPVVRPTRPPSVRPTRPPRPALTARHKRARAATPVATPLAKPRARRATSVSARFGATPIAGKRGHARRQAANEASPVARLRRGRKATPEALPAVRMRRGRATPAALASPAA
ncbi:MAG TPA: hypothetical protein VFI22_10435, partial [Thermomicrobiales bacterium]|nr:hypothetical protein [Thermomicrobiales bacterium]